MSCVTLLGVMLDAAAGRAACFTSCADPACVHASTTTNAPAVINAARIGLMMYPPPGWIFVEPSFQTERAILPTLVAKRDRPSGACQGGSAAQIAPARCGKAPGVAGDVKPWADGMRFAPAVQSRRRGCENNAWTRT